MNSQPDTIIASTEQQPPPPVLVIDDIPSLRALYQACLADAGYRPIAAKSAAEGLELFHRSGAQVVVLDLFLPDRDGLDLMREMLSLRPATAVIVVTADLSVDRAVEAMRLGARDFLVKPVREDRLLAAVAQAGRLAGATDAATDVATAVAEAVPFPGFIGPSQAVRDLDARLQAAAEQSAPVLVWGAEGAGRTLAARMIHILRPGAAIGPFIDVDCAAISSEGSEPADCQGLLRRTAEGTLFLGNITALERPLQAELARILSAGTSARLIFGAAMTAAEAEAAGTMAPELAAHLRDNAIRVPSLDERREDIVPLARMFLRRAAIQHGRNLRGFTPAAEEILCRQNWPGNVRQLISVTSAIATLRDGEAVTVTMLPVEMQPAGTVSPALPETLVGLTLADIEKIVIEDAIARYDGSVPRAAEELDVAPSTIYRKMGIWRKD